MRLTWPTLPLATISWSQRALVAGALIGAMLIGRSCRVSEIEPKATAVKQHRGSPRKQMQTLMADARACISDESKPLGDREWVMLIIAHEAELVSNFLREQLREDTDLADVAHEALGRIGHPRRHHHHSHRLAAVDDECSNEDRLSNLNAMATRAKLMRDELIAAASEIVAQPETPSTIEVRERATEIVAWFK